MNTLTIEFEGNEQLVAHIEGLQATLAKRNAQIADLTLKLNDALDGEPTQRALKDAYRRGWNACAASFGESGRVAAQLASNIASTMRKAQVDLYDRGEQDA